MNQLLGKPFSNLELVEFSREGERLACGSPIADNVTPALFGGFTLVKSTDPLKIVELPTLPDLYAIIIHPLIEIKTSDSRAVLPTTISLELATKQWANLGSLVHALHTENYELFSESLVDFIVEPHRSKLIPDFDKVKKESFLAGALGCGISGSGPTIFCIVNDSGIANSAANWLAENYRQSEKAFVHVCRADLAGARQV